MVGIGVGGWGGESRGMGVSGVWSQWSEGFNASITEHYHAELIGRVALPLGMERSRCGTAICFDPLAAATGSYVSRFTFTLFYLYIYILTSVV